MPGPRAEREAERALDTALSSETGRVELFRQLAAYEEAQEFERWCERWRLDPRDVRVFEHWARLHELYLVAWRRLGEAFLIYLRLGYTGLRLHGGPA